MTTHQTPLLRAGQPASWTRTTAAIASQPCQQPAPLRLHLARHGLLVLGLGLLLCLQQAGAATPAAEHAAPAASPKPAAEAPSADENPVAVDLKKAIRDQMIERKKLTLVVTDLPTKAASPGAKTTPETAAASGHGEGAEPAVAPRKVTSPAYNPATGRAYTRAKAAELAKKKAAEAQARNAHGDVHWSYSGATGPQAWGSLKPEYSACASGRRQSPINIDDTTTLQGPADPLRFDYRTSNAVVLNNGHTIQVNVNGENTLTVRGTVYKLIQFHFHTPSEELLNNRHSPMVAHLVHQNSQGELAVVAVLLDAGKANPVINNVWTHMPLDVNDQVRMPAGLLDLDDLLPKDQRYYQFMGSLTTPPCTEGVLWIVMKSTTQVSQEQLRLFQQQYPNNARPTQSVNGRPVREAL